MPERTSDGRINFYDYKPSLAAASIFVVLFSISAIFHIIQSLRKRSWFMTPFVIGGLFESVGYVGRIINSNDPYARTPYIVQILLILLAPALFAASIYMVLGRIILLTDGEKYSLIRRTWLTKIFVTSDVLSFLLQSGGGAIMASNRNSPSGIKRGQNIILVGLFAQIVVFGLFVVVAILFQLRGRKHLEAQPANIRWRKHLNVLYATSILILIRSIFRVVEYIMGDGSYLLEHEVFVYVFDALFMLAAMVLVNIVHPGDIATLLKEKSHMGSGYELPEGVSRSMSLRRNPPSHVHV